MKTGKSIMWGLFLVVLGSLLCVNAIGIIDFDIFFDGWWTLFVIVPCFIGLVTDDNKTGSVIGLIIGILLLLGCQDIIEFSLVGNLILPIIILVIGLSLLFGNMFNKKITKSIATINEISDPQEEYSAIFTGQDIKIDNQEFDGTKLNAIFGGIKLDLRNAIIKKDIVISGKAIFGGIDIYTPENVNVKVKSNSAFGGVDNKKVSGNSEITIYIDATCVFGGIDIK